MDRSKLTSDEVGARGQSLYDAQIRSRVETPDNIGKMVIIDVETGEYEIDTTGIDGARKLHSRRPNAAYLIRIGYKCAESLGGVMEREAT